MIATAPLSYDLALPPRVVFGWGRRRELGELVRPLGRRALLVVGSRTLERDGVVDELITVLSDAGVPAERLCAATREPTVHDVDAAVAAARGLEAGPRDVIVSLGGGSAIDLAKAIAGLAGRGGRGGQARVADYLEGVGPLRFEGPGLPHVALPTTAGTGSEATRNAVISGHRGDASAPFKKSLRHDSLLPRVALVDPELTVSCPPPVTAHSGLDALTQLIESFVSRRATPPSRALARDGLRAAAGALVEAVRDGRSVAARQRMAHAALLSGMSLANSGLGLAHGVAAALGSHCGTPHGLACAVMLPIAMRFNRAVAEDELAEIGALLEGKSASEASSTADAALARVDDLLTELAIPRRLSALGVDREALPRVARDARGNSLSGNPRAVAEAQLLQLLEENW